MDQKTNREKLKQAQAKVIEMPIKFVLDKNENIKVNSLKNITLILEHDQVLMNLFSFNEFTHEIDVRKDIPELSIIHGDMQDLIVPALLGYIEDRYRVLFSDKLLQMAITNVANKNSYNPVKDYMEDCYKKWDKKIRVADFLPIFLGAEKSSIVTLETKLFFVGAVAKVYRPDTKFDYVLDLVGGQGAGKTTLLIKMANGWYTDQFTNFKDKDNYINMLNSLIINDDEMTATKNSSFEDLKKFISARELAFRPPYGRYMVKRPKSFVMARTTNEKTYLKDKTGERRFMPIMADIEKQVKHPVTDLTKEIVAKMWGEFVYYYKSGEFDFYLDKEQNELMEKNRNDFMYIDQVEDEIEYVLKTSKFDFLTSGEIAEQMGEKNLATNRTLAKKIKYVMDNRKDWKPGSSKNTGVARRGYRRIK